MLEQKTFLRKTRRGQVIKVIREHYLRDDLHCGFSLCQLCQNDSSLNSSMLSSNPSSQVPNLYPQPHYIVADTNIVLEQMDVLESLTNVIVLQTVLDEVRHRSSPLYKRLKDLVADPKKHFVVFVNEHHFQTYICKDPGESPNDRNDRAIRKACEWYFHHLKDAGIGIALLSDDKENRLKSIKENEGYAVFRFEQYVQAISGNPLLMDKMRSKDNVSEKSHTKILYSEHLSLSDINRGIKNKIFHQGTFHVNPMNFMEGTVLVDSLDQPVLVQGLLEMNRSIDGDSVAVEIFDRKSWSAPSEVVLEDQSSGPLDEIEDKDVLKGSIPKRAKPVPTGKIVGIIKRKWRQYCGIIQPSLIEGSTSHLFLAAEKKIPKIKIITRQSELLKNQKIMVSIDSWPRHSRYPLGHFVRALGPIGDKATENQVLLLEHDIPHSSFSEAVLECLPTLPWIPELDNNRVDCRHLEVCSVDPPGCTDIDDALHSNVLSNGNIEVGVHIADVSHFIRPGSAIDKEAENRCTTVYLTDRRIDMVPELLSSNLCSLRGGEERYAFSCVWEMTPDTAQILNTKFHKSIIKSRRALTYEQAQNKIDDSNDSEPITLSLRRLLSLSKLLKRKRMDNGALVLASSEVRFTVDNETADPIDVQEKTCYPTNSMVEEFMLLANISVAKRIYEDFPDCALLRRHPAPPPSNFDSLVKAGKQCNFDIKIDTNKELSDSLNNAVNPKNKYINTMLRMIATRCMMQAVYFASGTIEEPLFQHYGLACPIYTHFTSPIRRFADVIVHRLLAASIGADVTYQELLDKKATQNIANNINYRHRMAQMASRASVNLHTHMFFRNKTRDETGYILFIRQNAIQILIPKYGLEGTLYLPRDKNFVYDETIPTQSCSGVTLSLFQQVVVQMTLDTTNLQHEKLNVKLVHPIISDFSVNPTLNNDYVEDKNINKRPLEEEYMSNKRKK